ncbi:MAG: YbgC/FadM family acyl-CoA thioesterase [Alphaproteobacteria bacterium]
MMINGEFKDKTHYYDARVHYADTDAGGVVYHSRYLDFCERARAGVLHLIDVNEIIELDGQSYFWVARKAELEYLAPAKVADIITIETRFTHLGGASIHVEHIIKNADKILVKAHLVMVLVSEKGRPQRIMPEIRHKMMPYVFEQMN